MRRTEGPREILPLTGLRALLAWWVVALHFVRELLAPGVMRSFLEAGHLAVDMFFVLSGYVLTKRYAGADLRDPNERNWFWLRRAARLYPLYVLSLAMGVLASPSALAALQTELGLVRLGLQILVLNAWTHVAMFHHNWAAWSLSVEMFFYLCFPLLLPRIRACSRRALSWLLVLMCALTWLAPTVYTLCDPDHLQRAFRFDDEVLWGWYLKFFPAQRLPEFAAGMVAARLVDTQRLIVSSRVRRVAAPVLGLALVGFGTFRPIPFAFIHAGVLLPLGVALVIVLDHEQRSWLAARWLVRLGHASYATYILHVPLFRVAQHWDPELWQHPLPVVGYLGLLLVVSLLAHALVERPLHGRMAGLRPAAAA